MGEHADYAIDRAIFGRGSSKRLLPRMSCDWLILGSTDKAWKVLNEGKWAWIPKALATTNHNTYENQKPTHVTSVARGSFTWKEYNFLED